MPIANYYLGCPGWAVKGWLGRFYPPGTKPTDFLEHYARIFNTVEGNTTFYALPTPETVARWRAQTPPEFRFCFKFPRTITHDKLLVNAGDDIARFLERVAPLEERLGTLFLQLPPQLGPAHLGRLREVLAELPKGFRFGVELRHEQFFAGGEEQAAAHALLEEMRVDLVVMDSRGLMASANPAFADVRGKKPALPVIMRATASQPLVRCVPHDDFEAHVGLVEPWLEQLPRWISEGKRPTSSCTRRMTRPQRRMRTGSTRSCGNAPTWASFRRGRGRRGSSRSLTEWGWQQLNTGPCGLTARTNPACAEATADKPTPAIVPQHRLNRSLDAFGGSPSGHNDTV